MRERRPTAGRFLTRTSAEWRALLPRSATACMNAMPSFGAAVLAAAAALEPFELAHLRALADGTASHRTVTADKARRILDRVAS